MENIRICGKCYKLVAEGGCERGGECVPVAVWARPFIEVKRQNAIIIAKKVYQAR